MILMSIMPKGINDFVVLCPVFFATAFQWYSFKGADGYASSSIFSTNNLRQFVTSFFEYLCDKEDSYLNKAKYYGGVLLYYHIGVAVSYISYVVMDARGILICLLPLAGALLLVCSKEGTIKLPGVLKSHS